MLSKKINTKKQITFPKGLCIELDKLAASRGVSFNELMRVLAFNAVDKDLKTTNKVRPEFIKRMLKIAKTDPVENFKTNEEFFKSLDVRYRKN